MTSPSTSRFSDLPLHELFEAQAARSGDRVAVSDDSRTLTYRDLDARANRLAHRLRQLGVGPDMRVALLLERSIDLVVAIIGTLKAGAAYVPLDLDSPRERLALLLEDAAPAAVVVHDALRDRLPCGDHVPVVVVSDAAWFEDQPATPLGAGATPASLAYVIYTSGSTGVPKGVLIEHGSVVHLLRASETTYDFGPDDVWTMFHSAAFDFSVWELWGALLYGGRLVVVPRHVAQSADECHALCVRERVTVLNQTPSAFQAFMEADLSRRPNADTLALRYVIFGGEALVPSTLRPWIAAHGDERPRLVNMYGITETTVHVTFHHVTRADADAGATGRSVIGRPLPGYSVRVLAVGSHALAPDGEAGEIVVGGAGVARGYLNRPALTAERFIEDTAAAGSARYYRSGDLGRRLPNGDLEYLGRIDQQVKIRGFRVELGEIEAVLGGHPAIAHAAVIVRDDAVYDKRLVAYWVRRAGAPVTSADLRRHLGARLPGYMVPAVCVELPEMPVTTNGKLNRRALTDMVPVGDDRTPAFEGPRDPAEECLAAIWREVLRLDRVGIHDNFFALGGHSLLATKVAIRIDARLGVRVRLSQLFERPTIADLATVLADAERSSSADAPAIAAPVPDAAGRRDAPMSFPQRGLWIVEQLTGLRTAYLLPEAWRLRGALNRAALGEALKSIVRRHAALRTRFLVDGGEPVQVVQDSPPAVLESTDLRSLVGHAQDQEVRRLMADEANRPLNLGRDVLLRARLLVLGDDDHVLLLTVHHIAFDAWSRQVLFRELGVGYQSACRGNAITPAALPIDYLEYSRRQRTALTAARETALLRYWQAQLAGATRLELPADGPRPLGSSDRGAAIAFPIPQRALAGLQHLAASTHATLHMVLAAAFLAVLARYSAQDDVAMATFTAGRDSADVEDLIGVFVNQVVLRVDVSGRPTFRELLARVRRVSLDAYDHRDLPFERLVADLHPDRRLGENPFARVAFQFLPFEETAPSLEGLETTRLPGVSTRSRFDMELTVSPAEDGLRGVLVYRTDVFSDDTITHLAARIRALLEAAAEAPDATIDGLLPLAPEERDQQLLAWSGIGALPPEIGCIHERFAAQAADTPDAPAVRFGSRTLTYRQLDEATTALAHRLRALGVGPGQVVAVHLERSAEMVVSLLSVLKAGGAYLPLDPANPADRLAFMMREQAVSVLIADRQVPPALADIATSVVTVPEGLDGVASLEAQVVNDLASPDRLAYVMYTSGSTGQPKGVGVPHQAVTRLVRRTDYVHIESTDRIAQASNASFDASTFEIWGALLNGATLVGIARDELLSPPQLAQAIAERGITVLFLTTALFHEAARIDSGMFAQLPWLLVGGEVLDSRAVQAVMAAGAPARLLNVYGPTENTTFSTWYRIPTPFEASASVPIGRPIAGSTCYVLDPHQALLPAGAAGELYVGGTGLALGYAGQPALTADRFLAHPFVPGERLYRTGDRVRWRTDGLLEFLGRFDRQVKLRGHRIELGEVEHALGRHEAVDSCVAMVREDRAGDRRLVAYWVPRRGARSTPDHLRQHLRRLLPEYMTPAAFVELTAWPLTANGKRDAAALPAPAPSAGHAERPEAPEGSLEAALAGVFRSVLAIDEVGRDESFFDLGGTSLGVFGLVDLVRQRLGRQVPVSDVFAHPTVAGLASLLSAPAGAASAPALVEVRRGSRMPPLYFPPGILGEVLVYDAIVAALPDDQPIYAFSHPVSATLDASLGAMAARFCDVLCAHQPEGPIALAGYSFAGLLAYEMARQLDARGRQLALVAIFDTGPDQLTDATVKGRALRLMRFVENLPRWIAEDLVRSFGADTPARLGRSIRKLVRSIGRRVAPPAQAPPHDRVEDLFDVSQWPSGLYDHVENNLRALAAFTYGRYDHPIVLFRARVRPLFNSQTRDLGWSALVPDVRIVDVPGNHHTMTIAPHIRVVARALSGLLDALPPQRVVFGADSAPGGSVNGSIATRS